MKRTLCCMAAGLVSILLIAKAEGTLISHSLTLDKFQESLLTTNSATGSALVTLDSGTELLSWNISFRDLVGTQVAEYFHQTSMPDAIPLVLASPVVSSAALTSSQATDMMAALKYVNIPSTVYSAGEIREQVAPEPATTAILGIGGLLVSMCKK